MAEEDNAETQSSLRSAEKSVGVTQYVAIGSYLVALTAQKRQQDCRTPN